MNYLLSFLFVSMKAKANFLRCIGYLSFTKDHTKLDLLLILVLVLPLNFLILTFCLTAIKTHVIRYCETVYETSNKNWFWSIKNSGEVLSKLKCRGFRATSLSTYDFSTLYTACLHMIFLLCIPHCRII